MSPEPLLDVGIVSFRCEGMLADCLASLRQHPAAGGIEGPCGRQRVWRRDRGDGAPRLPRGRADGEREQPGLQRREQHRDRRRVGALLPRPEPGHPGHRGALDEVLGILESDPRVGIAGPRLELKNGTMDHAARRSFPTPVSALGHFTGIGRRASANGALADYRAPSVESGAVDAVNGAFMLIRRRALEEVGTFDEGYWMYMEDTRSLLPLRRGRLGHLVRAVGDGDPHQGGRAAAIAPGSSNRAFHYGMYRFYRTHYAAEHHPTDERRHLRRHRREARRLGDAERRQANPEARPHKRPSLSCANGGAPVLDRRRHLAMRGLPRRAGRSMNEHLDGSQELVVVDNDSDDDPGAAAARWKGPGQFIPTGENLGFGIGSNLGTERARGPAVVLLNPDTELLDDGLDRLAATALERKALVGPRVLNRTARSRRRPAGPKSACGRGSAPSCRAAHPRLGRRAHRALEARTGRARVLADRRVRGRPHRCAPQPRPLRSGASHVRRGPRPRPPRCGGRIGSIFSPGAASIVHHGGGSSSLAYGGAEGWRPMGAIQWRAVCVAATERAGRSRAHSPRRTSPAR